MLALRMPPAPLWTALAVYSVFWGDERIVVVDAPSREAVEKLVARYTCDQEDCDHCAHFFFVDGVEGLSLKPVHVSHDGKFLRGFWESVLPWGVLMPFLGVVAIARWAFQSHHEPEFVRWPQHPERLQEVSEMKSESAA